jgi:hypoxanthine phosphoribosyltransferase
VLSSPATLLKNARSSRAFLRAVAASAFEEDSLCESKQEMCHSSLRAYREPESPPAYSALRVKIYCNWATARWMRKGRGWPFDTLAICIDVYPPLAGKEAFVEQHPDLDHILFTEDQIRERVKEMGAQITKDYAGKSIVVISVLRGAAIFMADLVREIHLPVEMDYMAISSYGNGMKSSGVVRILKDLSSQIEGRHVLIAEDILDSGLTLRYLMKNLESRGPASIEVATLLRKDTPNQADIKCKYIGFECPDEFIVGYGLDYEERYRNLSCIGVLKSEVTAE